MDMYQPLQYNGKGEFKPEVMDKKGLIELCDKVKRIQGHDRFMLSFSAGSDSIALFLRILESGQFDMTKGIYFYYYNVPNITWVDEYLDYFEDKYNIKIERLPSPNFVEGLRNYHYQTPARAYALDKMSRMGEWPIYDKSDIEREVKFAYGVSKKTLCAVGVKQGDSALRRQQMRRMRGLNVNQGKWYPIFDFENKDVPAIINRHDVKMPFCYELFGISFENIDFRFSKPIRDNCPNNWENIKKYYPMADSIISRTEYYHGDRVTRGVYYKKFSDRILQPKKPL